MASPISPDFRARIDHFDWYQRIPLGDGYETPGEDTFTAQKLPMLEMPTDLTGKSVLDIGCSEGFFAREAEHRGATRIVGIDTAPGLACKNALLEEITGSRLEFREQTVYDLAPETSGTFDLVIFLSVFQHLDYPFQALDLISAVTERHRDHGGTGRGISRGRPGVPAGSLRHHAAKRQGPPHLPAERADVVRDVVGCRISIDSGPADPPSGPREVPGYDGRYGQERLILQAHKGDARL